MLIGLNINYSNSKSMFVGLNIVLYTLKPVLVFVSSEEQDSSSEQNLLKNLQNVYGIHSYLLETNINKDLYPELEEIYTFLFDSNAINSAFILLKENSCYVKNKDVDVGMFLKRNFDMLLFMLGSDIGINEKLKVKLKSLKDCKPQDREELMKKLLEIIDLVSWLYSSIDINPCDTELNVVSTDFMKCFLEELNRKVLLKKEIFKFYNYLNRKFYYSLCLQKTLYNDPDRFKLIKSALRFFKLFGFNKSLDMAS